MNFSSDTRDGPDLPPMTAQQSAALSRSGTVIDAVVARIAGAAAGREPCGDDNLAVGDIEPIEQMPLAERPVDAALAGVGSAPGSAIGLAPRYAQPA